MAPCLDCLPSLDLPASRHWVDLVSYRLPLTDALFSGDLARPAGFHSSIHVLVWVKRKRKILFLSFFFSFWDSKSLFSPRFGLGEELEDSESLFSPRQFWIGGRMRGQNHSSIHVLDWVKNEIKITLQSMLWSGWKIRGLRITLQSTFWFDEEEGEKEEKKR